MGLDRLRFVQIIWAAGDVLLTGGAVSLLGIYGGDENRNCRRAGLVLWSLCGVAPMVMYILGYLIVLTTKGLQGGHPANLKLLTMIAAADNIVIGLLYQHRKTECGSVPTNILLVIFGAMPVWGNFIRHIVKACHPGRRHFEYWKQGPEGYPQDYAPSGASFGPGRL